jgi:molecular chaperone DnaK (HSP70)
MEKKYIVKVINVFSNLISVDANNEEEAKEKAKELLLNKPEGEEFEHLYESTLPSDHWAVITKEDFDKLKEDFQKSLEPDRARRTACPEVPGVEE